MKYNTQQPGILIDDHGNTLFLDEITQWPEPERSKMLRFMANEGDAEANEIISRKPAKKQITSYTKEYVASIKDNDFQRQSGLQCVHELIEHYYHGTGGSPGKIAKGKEICYYLSVGDIGSIRTGYAHYMSFDINDVLQILDWLHEYSVGAVKLDDVYKFRRKQIEEMINSSQRIYNEEALAQRKKVSAELNGKITGDVAQYTASCLYTVHINETVVKRRRK